MMTTKTLAAALAALCCTGAAFKVAPADPSGGGDAPTVVLVHGDAPGSPDWNGLTSLLQSKGCTVVTLWASPHPDANPEDMAALILTAGKETRSGEGGGNTVPIAFHDQMRPVSRKAQGIQADRTLQPLEDPSAPQSAREVLGPAAVVPLPDQPPARLIMDTPLADQLANGRVVIQYRAENLRIVPVFGPAALAVSPRIGHIHVTVDDATWHWADASGEPLILNGFTPGPHRVLLELVDANHKPLDRRVVRFVIPDKPVQNSR